MIHSSVSSSTEKSEHILSSTLSGQTAERQMSWLVIVRRRVEHLLHITMSSILFFRFSRMIQPIRFTSVSYKMCVESHRHRGALRRDSVPFEITSCKCFDMLVITWNRFPFVLFWYTQCGNLFETIDCVKWIVRRTASHCSKFMFGLN